MPHLPPPSRHPAASGGVDVGALFDEVGPVAFGLAERMLEDAEDAAEVVRAAFAECVTTAQQAANLRSRIIATVHRRAVQLLRARPTVSPRPAADAAPIADVLRLTYRDGLSLSEVATRCGISRADAARALTDQLTRPRATPELRIVAAL